MNSKIKKLTTENSKVLAMAFAAIIAGSSTITSCKKDEGIVPTEQSTYAMQTDVQSLVASADSNMVAATAAAATSVDLRIDLGSTASSGNYNKASIGVSSPVALKDFVTGATTGVKLATTAAFKGAYDNSTTYPSTLGIPQAVASDLYYNGSGATSALELSGLNTATAYDLSFFASRMDYKGSLETQYKVIGATTQTVVLEAANNTSKTVSVQGIKPNSAGKIIIQVSKGSKNSNSSGNYWLNYVRVTGTSSTVTEPAPTPIPPTTEVSGTDLRIDLGTTASTGNYNNASIGVSSPVALKDFVTGATTGVKIATTAAFKGAYNNTITYPSALGIPQAVASDLYYNGSGATSALELSGLNTATAYNLSFFASRMDYSGSLETQFKVIGATTQTVVLEAANNTSKLVTVSGIKPNSSGKILIQVSKGPKNSNSSGNYWLNYLRVTSASSTTTPPPTTTTPPPTTTTPPPTTTTPPPTTTTPPPTTTTPPPTANYTVSNYTDLVAALSKATSGQVVYITDNVEINVTGKPALVVKGGVTIASGRGINGSKGARIYTTSVASNPVIQISGAGAKVSGLRIDGPTTTESNSSSTYHRGITTSYDNTTVEYCELSGFNHTPILFSKGAQNGLVSYNYIHHNPASGLGYGVVFSDDASGLVTHNIFDRNRHAIATGGYVSSGYKLNGYEASFNTVFRGNTQNVHDFDGHGANDEKTVAGTLYNIHDNTFYNTKASFSFQLRGYPQDRAIFMNNKTVLKALTSSSGTSVAVGFTPGDVNRQTPPTQYFTISGNQVGIAVPAGIPTDLNAKLPDALAPLPSR